MSDTLVAVPASDEEHGRTVGDSSDDSSSCNTCTGRVNFAAGSGVASDSSTITGTSS